VTAGGRSGRRAAELRFVNARSVIDETPTTEPRREKQKADCMQPAFVAFVS